MDLHAVIHEEDGSYWAALVLGQERTSTEPVTVRVDELKLVTA